MFLVAMLAPASLGVVIERFAYRPLRDAPRLAPLISALGVSFFLQNSALLLFGAEFRSYDSFLLGSAQPELFVPGSARRCRCSSSTASTSSWSRCW